MKSFYHVTPEFTKFYALLADSPGTPAYGLWALLRAIDVKGSGFVVVSLSEIRDLLNCSRATVYRWLGSSLFFWKWKNLGDGLIRVHYKSPKRIYQALKIQDIGAIAKLPIVYIQRNHRKVAATELETMRLQSQAAHHAANQQRGNIIDPLEAARSDSSLFSRGSNPIRRKFLILDANAPVCPHGSLRTVAKRMGRSCSTIQRRLSDDWRAKQDLSPIPKQRIARKLSPDQVLSQQFNLDREHFTDCPDFHKSATYFVNPKSSSYQFVTTLDGDRCFLGGNIYGSDMQSTGYRRERRGIKQFLSLGKDRTHQ